MVTLNIKQGLIGAALPKSTHDWGYQTVPQTSAQERVIATARGKMLGGSSGLNFLAWNRASRHEYDAWKAVSYEPGDSESDAWDWDGILPYFKKSESTPDEAENPRL